MTAPYTSHTACYLKISKILGAIYAIGFLTLDESCKFIFVPKTLRPGRGIPHASLDAFGASTFNVLAITVPTPSAPF